MPTLINPWDPYAKQKEAAKQLAAQRLAQQPIPGYTTNVQSKANAQQAVNAGTALALPKTSVNAATAVNPVTIPPAQNRSYYSLTGTMSGTAPTTFGSSVSSRTPEQTGEKQGERSLSETSGVANFKQGLQQIDDYYRNRQQTPDQVMQALGQQLGQIINPNVMTGALDEYATLKQRSAGSLFQNALEIIDAQEQRQNDYRKMVFESLPDSIKSTMTGEEFDQIRSGNISPELKQKIAEATMLEQGTQAGFTLSEGQQRYDAQGNLIASFGAPSSTLTGVGVVTTSTGDMYDIGSYATDPTHEAKIQNLLNTIGKMNTVQDMDAYIQSVAPGSPVTGQMIANASQKYGVSWEAMMAIMQQDSSFGTAGKAVRTFNPGNVGNTDSGATVNMGNWQNGVDAVAQNLASRKTTQQSTGQIDFNDRTQVDALPISDPAKSIIVGYGSMKDLTPTDKKQVLSELYKVGYDPKKEVLNKLDALLVLKKQIPLEFVGLLEGWKPAFLNPQASKFESAKAVLTRIVARLNDVGMLSDQDVASYKSAMPARYDLDQVTSAAKVAGLKEAIGASSATQTLGQTPSSGILSSGLSYTIE